jgi:hypothetical protein
VQAVDQPAVSRIFCYVPANSRHRRSRSCRAHVVKPLLTLLRAGQQAPRAEDGEELEHLCHGGRVMDEMLDLVDLGAASSETKGDIATSCWDGVGWDLCSDEDPPMCRDSLDWDDLCASQDSPRVR